MPNAQTKLPFHQQDVDVWCGAAIAQMMLASIDGDIHDQRFLYQVIGRINDASWHTSPRALAYVLNKKSPRDFDRTFVACLDTRREDACKRIASTILTTGIAVPAVVFGSKHWVAVTGVVYGDDDGEYNIKGFYVNNPWPRTAKLRFYRDPTIASPPPPHDVQDACGGGDKFGSADTYVTSYGWRTIFWPVPADDNGRRGYMTVSSIPEAGTVAVRVPQKGARIGSVATGPISPDDAKRYAVAGIDGHGIARDGPLARLLLGAEPTFAVAVDSGEERYYLVRFARTGIDVALACVDAHNGEFVGVLAPPTQIPSRELLESILDATQRAAITDPERLIWRPCRQSLSPFYPLLANTIAGDVYYLESGPHLHPSIDDNLHA